MFFAKIIVDLHYNHFKNTYMNRRKMLKITGAAIAGASVLRSSVIANADQKNENKPTKQKKALIIGAHPDDPETACGGTMILLKQAGYDVVSVYMTKGEAGIAGISHDKAAATRMQEARKACEILGAKAIFMTQTDGRSEVNKERYHEMRDLIKEESPDIVFTHWPIDSHPDHRVCSLLVYDAWRRLNYEFELYYFEVMSGTQTQLFQPTDYIDITSVAQQKKNACLCHISQDMPHLYSEWHDRMEHFRGIEYRCDRAEAFIHLRHSSNDIM